MVTANLNSLLILRTSWTYSSFSLDSSLCTHAVCRECRAYRRVFKDKQTNVHFGQLKTCLYVFFKQLNVSTCPLSIPIYFYFSTIKYYCKRANNSLIQYIYTFCDGSAGEEITIQYITFLFGNTRRRKDIKVYTILTIL